MSVDLAIVGLGYVGLPLAQEASRAGLSVVGFDVNQGVVDGLNSGTSHVDDLSDADVAAMLAAGFRATDRPKPSSPHAATVVICVPTPLSDDGGPDLGAVRSATAAVARNLHPGTLVVLESTTYPGTTEEVAAARARGRRPQGRAPTSIWPSPPSGSTRATRSTASRTRPRSSAASPRRAPSAPSSSTAASSTRWCSAKGTREAETAKLLENTYRHINIALVNEMARFCHELDIDLWDVIRLRQDQALRLPGVLPGPGRRRSLHPDRPELPQLLGAQPARATRSGSSSSPRRSTRRCPATSPTGPRTSSTPTAWRPRAPRCCCSGSPTSPTSPTSASRPAVDLAKALLDLGAEVTLPRPLRHGVERKRHRGAAGRGPRGGRRSGGPGDPGAEPQGLRPRRPGRRVPSGSSTPGAPPRAREPSPCDHHPLRGARRSRRRPRKQPTSRPGTGCAVSTRTRPSASTCASCGHGGHSQSSSRLRARTTATRTTTSASCGRPSTRCCWPARTS